MEDKFLFDSDGVSSTIDNLKNILDEYSGEVSKLEELINNIESSSDWVDTQVKNSYINSCRSYIDSFRKYISGLQAYIAVLTKKSANIDEFEETFSK